MSLYSTRNAPERTSLAKTIGLIRTHSIVFELDTEQGREEMWEWLDDVIEDSGYTPKRIADRLGCKTGTECLESNIRAIIAQRQRINARR